MTTSAAAPRFNALIRSDESRRARRSILATPETFLLDGQEYTAINGGPQFPFTEAVSLLVNCADQDEVDYYWSKLTADGGEESMCGWLKDKYGLSWQIVPPGFVEIMNDPDPQRGARAMKAMFGMRKVDLAALRAAADGTE